MIQQMQAMEQRILFPRQFLHPDLRAGRAVGTSTSRDHDRFYRRCSLLGIVARRLERLEQRLVRVVQILDQLAPRGPVSRPRSEGFIYGRKRRTAPSQEIAQLLGCTNRSLSDMVHHFSDGPLAFNWPELDFGRVHYSDDVLKFLGGGTDTLANLGSAQFLSADIQVLDHANGFGRKWAAFDIYAIHS